MPPHTTSITMHRPTTSPRDMSTGSIHLPFFDPEGSGSWLAPSVRTPVQAASAAFTAGTLDMAQLAHKRSCRNPKVCLRCTNVHESTSGMEMNIIDSKLPRSPFAEIAIAAALYGTLRAAAPLASFVSCRCLTSNAGTQACALVSFSLIHTLGLCQRCVALRAMAGACVGQDLGSALHENARKVSDIAISCIQVSSNLGRGLAIYEKKTKPEVIPDWFPP